jgi:16S rRNA (uracil1498-N3)-methyltransferase
MLPYFYIPSYDEDHTEIILDEESSRHIVQVLRMDAGEHLQLTDGKGSLLEAVIRDAHKKKCLVTVGSVARLPFPEKKVSVAISALKNAHRFEWFLEKATEIGVARIIPLLCDRTEKHHLRQERMQHILVSAMLQSQQTWLPELALPASFKEVIADASQTQRFIAYCGEDKRSSLSDPQLFTDETGSTPPFPVSRMILIGPEGDFTQKEIALALEQGFIPVSLGNTRLRTETAGIVAAAILCAV